MRANLVRVPEPEIAQVLNGPLDEPGITFTATGLTIEKWVGFEQWEKYGRKLQLAEKGIQWALGDWIIHGENTFKERAAQAIEFTGLKIKTLQNYAVVAKAITKSRRRDSDVVDFSTHAEVAMLPAEEQERILAKAEEDPEHATRKEIRREVHNVKRRLGQEHSEIDVLKTPEVQDWLQGLHAELIEREGAVPSSAPFLRSMIQSMDGMVLWQSERTVEGDCRAILEMFEGGGGTSGVYRANDSDIYKWLQKVGYFMRDPELDERLEYMVNNKMLEIQTVEEGRQEGRRGVMVDLYRIHPEYLRKGK